MVELRLELVFVDRREDVHEVAVVGLQDGVLGGEVQRPTAHQGVVEAGAGEPFDRHAGVVHRHRHAATVAEAVHFQGLRRTAIGRLVGHRDLAGTGDLHFRGAIDVAIGMAADDDRLGPVRHQARHILADDRLAEDRAVQDVAQRAIRAAIHPLQAEFRHPGLVRGNGRAFYADAVLGDRVGRIDGHLIVRLVTVFDTEVIIFQIDIQVRKDQLVLDKTPDNAGHLVPVQLDDRGLDLDFCHHILIGGTQLGPPSRRPNRSDNRTPCSAEQAGARIIAAAAIKLQPGSTAGAAIA